MKLSKKISKNIQPPGEVMPESPLEIMALLHGNEWKLLFGIILLTIVLRINLINIPYERDEGAYIYFGQMLLQGQVPYQDFYEDKPPGNMYSYAALVAVFGPEEGNIHGAFMVLNILTLLLGYLLLKRLFGVIPALCAAASFATLSLSPAMCGFSCMSEHLVMFYVMIGMALLLGWKKDIPFWQYMLAGMALGMAVWVKQSGIFFFLWGIAAILLADNNEYSGRWRRLLWFGAGAAVVSLVFFAQMWKLGVFRQFWFSVVELPSLFVTPTVPFQIVKYVLKLTAGVIFRENSLSVILAIAGVILLAVTDKSRNEKLVIWLLVCASLLAVVPGYTFYAHYWLQVIPAAIIGVAIVISLALKFSSRVTGPGALKWELAIILLFCLGKGYMFAQRWDYYFGNNNTAILRGVYGDNPFPSSKRIGDYLRNRSHPGDKLAILGSEPQIFLYSRCRNATRHAFITHLVNPRNPYAADWRKEYITDVEKAAPHYIVYVAHPASWCCEGNSCAEMDIWADKYLRESYELVAYSDIILGEPEPHLVWDDEARTYHPKGQCSVRIFERKDKV
ncbi:MAG: glycosyltransferase family 39 protein [Elusimicrobia bacterium]|nr:glycosyltransferase family 39 protein [Elusimicrobiota bacterium]